MAAAVLTRQKPHTYERQAQTQRPHWELIAQQSLMHRQTKERKISELQKSLDSQAGFTFKPSVSRKSSEMSQRSRSRTQSLSQDPQQKQKHAEENSEVY